MLIEIKDEETMVAKYGPISSITVTVNFASGVVEKSPIAQVVNIPKEVKKQPEIPAEMLDGEL